MHSAFIDPKSKAHTRQCYAGRDGSIEFRRYLEYKAGNRGSACKRLNRLFRLPNEKAGNSSPDQRVSKSTEKVNCLARKPFTCRYRLSASLLLRRHGDPSGCTVSGAIFGCHQGIISIPPPPSLKFYAPKARLVSQVGYCQKSVPQVCRSLRPKSAHWNHA